LEQRIASGEMKHRRVYAKLGARSGSRLPTMLTPRQREEAFELISEFKAVERCLVAPDERRGGRTWERVQETLLELKGLMAERGTE
jgi:hypothetical protein